MGEELGWHSCNLEPLALVATAKAIGVCIVIKGFRFGIPLQFATKLHRDIAQVASRYAAMLTFDIGNRLAPRVDAVKEVSHVIDDRRQLATPLRTIQIVKVIAFPVGARQWFLR